MKLLQNESALISAFSLSLSPFKNKVYLSPAVFLMLFLISLSCEKIDYDQDNVVEPDSSQIYTGNSIYNLGNSSISVDVKDGMLAFQDVNAFYDAMTIIGNSSDDEISQWVETKAYKPLWEEYSEVVDYFEKMDSFSEDFLNDYPDGRYELVLDDGAYLVVPFVSGKSLSILLNTEGMVLINDQLHYFNDDFHVLVADKNKDLLRSIIKNPYAGWDQQGVVVTLQEPATTLIEDASKIAYKLVSCPSEGVAHRQTVGNKRLVAEMFTYLFTTNWSSNTVQYNASLRFRLHNYEKKRWRWRRTDSDLITSLNQPGRFVHNIRAGSTIVDGTSTLVRSIFVDDDYTDAVSVDKLVVASLIFGPKNLSQDRYFNLGLRFRGRRSGGDVTSPNLDIVLGCN